MSGDNESTAVSSSSGPEDETGRRGQMKRHRRSKGKRKKEQKMQSRTVQQLLWVGLLLLTLLLLINPWRWFVPDDAQQLFGAGRTLYWLAYEGGSRIVGLLLLLATAVWGFFLLRDRINDTSTLYATACPRCGSHHLKRTRRTTLDRLWGALGMPVRRYICAECKWQGARIDHTRLMR